MPLAAYVLAVVDGQPKPPGLIAPPFGLHQCDLGWRMGSWPEFL